MSKVTIVLFLIAAAGCVDDVPQPRTSTSEQYQLSTPDASLDDEDIVGTMPPSITLTNRF